MSWRTDLLDRVEADGTIVAITGTNIAWFERKRSQPFPALVLHEISPGREYSHDGATGLDDPRVQFDLWVDDPAQLEPLETAVMAMMEQAATIGGTDFEFAFLLARRTMEPEDLADGVRVFGLQLDFSVMHSAVA